MSCLSNRWHRMVLYGKSSSECPVNTGVPQGFLLGPTLLLLYINDLPDGVISNIDTYADDTTHTVDWSRKLLVDVNAEKSKLVLIGQPSNTGAIDVKMDGSVLEEKSSLKMFGLSFSPKLGWSSYTISIAKTDPQITGALIRSM